MKTRYMLSCAAAAVLSGWSVAAVAADTASAPIATAPAAATSASGDSTSGPAVEEVVVTANRRSESVQKVPMTVQAFSGDTLSKLNITTLDDLLKYTPNVTFATNGPGQGSIFMRGLSAGFAGNQSSATIGNFPNVAIYLDDQSMQFPARNVDIYMVDMSRVEVLEGPQGTLFGGGAEAGALRYITNKPKFNVFEGDAHAGYGFTSGGGPNTQVDATVNIPIIQDKLAIRAVAYNEQQGGYITNEPSTFTRSNKDNGNYYFGISPSTLGAPCPNGQAAGPVSKPFPKGLCTVPGAQQINNANLTKTQSNPTSYTGARLSIAWQIDPTWDVLIAQSVSNLDAEGLSSEEPIGSDFQTLKPLQVTSFEPSYDKDNWENTAWTLNGKVGPLKLIYTGGYMDRHISQQEDYTNYSRTGGGIYYECVGGQGGLLGASKATPSCYSPLGYWNDQVHNTHLSNEVRVSSPDDWRLRFIAGAYEEQFRIYDVMNFDYKTIPDCDPTNLTTATAGGPICVANVRTAPGSTANDPGVRGDSVGFGEDTQRGYDQTAFFGSADFDIIPHVLTITGGTRYFDYHETEVGSQYGTNGSCVNVANGNCNNGVLAGSGEINIDSHHDTVNYKGFKSRASITWHPTSNTTLYYLFSQGFRPGGFSRSSKAVIDGPDGKPQYQEPNGYAPDSLTNNEWGAKTELFNRRLLLNISAYDMNWTNVQYLIFNPTEGINTTFGTNGPSYNIKGIELQAVGKVMEGLTVQGSATYDDDAQSNSPCLVDNISGTASFNKCITQVKLSDGQTQTFTNPFGKIGSVPAFSPKFQGNIRGRYDWTFQNYKANIQVGGNYMDSMYNVPGTYPSGTGVTIPTTTILRYYQPAYATMDASIGVSKDTWTVGLFATNLFDNHASTFTSAGQFIKTELPLRPTVFMLKVGDRF